jgi:hypothetical protein
VCGGGGVLAETCCRSSIASVEWPCILDLSHHLHAACTAACRGMSAITTTSSATPTPLHPHCMRGPLSVEQNREQRV